ncbi:response regulator transcription factor [Chloroflexi bacterium TSY]|nr:response regulator transcription factor [Chloroflexi bacterium TSY]
MKDVVRIVIVDDQQPARLGLKALLSLVPQIDVVGEASNGEAALALVAEEQPDVVLMDVEMPVIDGLAATQAIKDQSPAVGVVIITVQPKHRTAAIAAGADAFLLKGTTSELLLNTIVDVANPTD